MGHLPGRPVRSRNPSTLRTLRAAALAAVLLPALPLAGAAQVEDGAQLGGKVFVRPEDGGGVLAGVRVKVQAATGRIFLAFTDDDGTYRIQGLPPGIVEIMVTRVGFRPHAIQVRLPPGGDLSLDVEMAASPIEMPGLMVRGATDPDAPPGSSDPGDVAAELGTASVSRRVLEVTPGLAETLTVTSTPGADVSAPTVAGLYARSAGANPGLVMLDGGPVRTPFSLTGVLPAVDTTLFRRSREHEGGAPARYDGGLSHVLELRSRRPGNELQGRVSLDAVSAAGSVGGPLWNGASFALSGRALHDHGPALIGGGILPVGYGEGLLRLESAVGGSTLALTAFRNRERTRFDTPSSGGGAAGGADAEWGNEVVVTRWRGSPGGVDARVVASWSRYHAGLSPAAGATSRTDRSRASIEVAIPTVPGVRAAGFVAERIELRPPSSSDATGTMASAAMSSTLGGFLEGGWGGRELAVDWGLRLDGFRPGGTRAAVRGRVAWAPPGESTVVSLGIGRYHQVGQGLWDGPGLELGGAANPEFFLAPETGTALPEIGVSTADHVVAGLEQVIGEVVAISTRLHFKRYRGLAGPGSDRVASSGADVRVGWASRGRSLNVGYALTWTWDQEGDPPRFDERHILTARGRTPLPGPFDLRLAASWGDGLPLSAIRLEPPVDPEQPGGQPPRSSVDDGFLRLNVEVSADWTDQAGDRRLRLRPYLRLLNRLDSRDTLFRYIDPDGDAVPGGVAGRSLVPVLGLEMSF